MFDKKLTLSNGVEIPQLALGTWLIDNSEVSEAVRSAISLGYRHIDTAQAYGNENGVGEGIRKSGIEREKIFVTSKVAAEYKDYKSAAASIDDTLRQTGLGYLDMMIIHSPQPWALVNQSDDRFIEGNREAWRALEDAYKDQKLRAIGVSNFLEKDIDSLYETAKIKPMVNQVLCHISNSPLALIDYCTGKGMVMEAYSPIAHGEALKNPTISEMAAKYKVSIPQLCIRFDIQLGTIVIPKAASPVHMKTNSDIDFVISDDDMQTLKNVKHIENYGKHSFFPVFGGKM